MWIEGIASQLDRPLGFGATSWLLKLLAAAQLVLLAATYPVWLPQDVFPQVPWLPLWVGAAPAFEWLALATLLAALGLVIFSEPASAVERIAALMAAAGWLALIALDQHRTQPWAVQAIVLLVAWNCLPHREAAIWLRLFLISIYVYSALSKLDVSFARDMAPLFASGLARSLGLTGLASAALVRGATDYGWLLPLAELTAGVALSFPRTWPWSTLAIVGLHALLLAALGPWGLDHSAGVVLWNVVSIGLALCFFGSPPRAKSPVVDVRSAGDVRSADVVAAADTRAADSPAAAQRFRRAARWLVRGGMLLVLVWPATEPFGWCDTWLAWAVYAPRNERLELFVATADAARVPRQWQPYLAVDAADPRWMRLRIDAWSLASVGVPLYPQQRFQLGVARGVIAALPADLAVRVVLWSAADRHSGQRQSRVLDRESLATAAPRYWFNSTPRDNLNQ